MAQQTTPKGTPSSPQLPMSAPEQAPAAAPAPKPRPDVRDSVSSGPARGPDGKFAAKAQEAPPKPRESIGALVSAEEKAARDAMYRDWPEMAESTWGPRPAEQKEQPEAQDAPKAEAATPAAVPDKDTQRLKLAGFTDSAIAKLGADDAKAIAAHLALRDAEFDKKLRDAADIKKQATAEPEPKKSAEPRPLPDALKEVAQSLADEIGSEKAGEALTKGFGALHELIAQQQEAAANAALHAEITKARAELVASRPELGDDAKFRAILEEADDLRSTKRWGSRSIAEQIAEAHRTLFPGPTQEEKNADRLQRQGLATPPPATAPAPAPRTHKRYADPFDTAAFAAYDALAEGGTVSEATIEGRRALGV